MVDGPMNKDIRATSSDLGVPPAEISDPISSHPSQTLGPKHIHMTVVGQVKSIRFFLPAVKAMSSSYACTSSFASPWILILNESFHRMLDYNAKYNKFFSTYNDMVIFLSEVHI